MKLTKYGKLAIFQLQKNRETKAVIVQNIKYCTMFVNSEGDILKLFKKNNLFFD